MKRQRYCCSQCPERDLSLFARSTAGRYRGVVRSFAGVTREFAGEARGPRGVLRGLLAVRDVCRGGSSWSADPAAGIPYGPRIRGGDSRAGSGGWLAVSRTASKPRRTPREPPPCRPREPREGPFGALAAAIVAERSVGAWSRLPAPDGYTVNEKL